MLAPLLAPLPASFLLLFDLDLGSVRAAALGRPAIPDILHVLEQIFSDLIRDRTSAVDPSGRFVAYQAVEVFHFQGHVSVVAANAKLRLAGLEILAGVEWRNNHLVGLSIGGLFDTVAVAFLIGLIFFIRTANSRFIRCAKCFLIRTVDIG